VAQGGDEPAGGAADVPTPAPDAAAPDAPDATGAAAGAGADAAAAAASAANPFAGLPPLFLGTHQPRLDDKGRLFLPARFRDDLAAGLVITRGQERCLYVFPAAEFARLYTQVRGASFSNKGPRDFMRMFLSGGSLETPDKQGRVTLPQPLREYAGLTKDCVVIGVGARLEVWDAQAWDAYVAENENAFAEQSEEVLPGFI
jgi:MraZ protein